VAPGVVGGGRAGLVSIEKGRARVVILTVSGNTVGHRAEGRPRLQNIRRILQSY
jgi:hypothetical protein